MTFQEAQLKLLAQVRDRIRNGELTERGFARLIGISQPHAHNVLKGVRKLSPRVSDAILKFFHMSLLDLLSLEELQEHLLRRTEARLVEVPLLESPIGPGMPWPVGLHRGKRFPLPFRSPAPFHLVMVNLAQDPQMAASLTGYDIALLDTSELAISAISSEGIYAVEREKEAILRYLRPGAASYYLVSDATMDRPRDWEKLRILPRELIRTVKGRVLWIGRERDRDQPPNQRGRFL